MVQAFVPYQVAGGVFDLGFRDIGPSSTAQLNPVIIEEIADDFDVLGVQNNCVVGEVPELEIDIHSDCEMERDRMKGDMSKEYCTDSE